jgi:hypothetical protein
VAKLEAEDMEGSWLSTKYAMLDCSCSDENRCCSYKVQTVLENGCFIFSMDIQASLRTYRLSGGRIIPR